MSSPLAEVAVSGSPSVPPAPRGEGPLPVLSVTSVATALVCPRLDWFGQVEGRSTLLRAPRTAPGDEPDPLRFPGFGTRVHALVEVFLGRNSPSASLQAAFSCEDPDLRASRIRLHLEEDLYRRVMIPEVERIGHLGHPPPEVLVTLWGQLQVFLESLVPYLTRAARALPPEQVLARTVLAWELPMEASLGLPGGGAVRLRGRLDGLWFDHTQERPLIVELKTRPLSGAGEDFLQLALYQLLLERANGVVAGGRLLALAGDPLADPVRGPGELSKIRRGEHLGRHLEAMLAWRRWSPGRALPPPGPADPATCFRCPVRSECRTRLGSWPERPGPPGDGVAPAPAPPEPPGDPASCEGAPMQILLGSQRDADGAWLTWSPNDTEQVLNPNMAILGTMGTGKTQLTRSLLHQVGRASGNVGGVPPRFLVFDYKGDYSAPDFVEAVGATVWRAHQLPFQPLELLFPEGDRDRVHLPVFHTAQAFAESLSRAASLGEVQRNRLQDLVLEAYAASGIRDDERESWSLPPPSVQQVTRAFFLKEKLRRDRLYGVLRELEASELYHPGTPGESPRGRLLEQLAPVTVVDLKGGISASLQKLTVATLLERVFAEVQLLGDSRLGGLGRSLRELRLFLLVDEADEFMQAEFPVLRRLLKEGRSYGLGVLLSTQYLRHFSTRREAYAENFSTWILHRFPGLKNSQIQTVFGVTGSKAQEAFRKRLGSCEKHQSLVRIGTGPDFLAIDDLPHFRLGDVLGS